MPFPYTPPGTSPRRSRGASVVSANWPTVRIRGRRLLLTLSLLLTSLFAFGSMASGEEPGGVDFSAWQRLPVFHNGRMMPLNTYARLTVEDVCGGRTNPRLSLEGVSEETQKSPEFAETQKLFPQGRRKFTAAELLFSWTVEPERWEYVPFLIAEHESLREKILGVPVLSAEGKHLKYVSPHDVDSANDFWNAVRALSKKHREAGGKKLKLTSREVAINELYGAYVTYRQVSFDPFSEPSNTFLGAMVAVKEKWNSSASAWTEARSSLALVARDTYGDQFAGQFEAVQGSLAAIDEELQKSEKEFDLRKLEGMLTEAMAQASELAAAAELGMQEVFAHDAPPMASEAQWRQIRNASHIVASGSAGLVLALKQAQLALFDSRKTIRVLPALNPAALEKNRDPDDEAQPWLSLQTVLFSSDDVYRCVLWPDLPEGNSEPISPGPGETRLSLLERLANEGNSARTERLAFTEAATAYTDRDASDRGARFNGAMARFADEIRALGESVEPFRAELVMRDADADLIELTAYPPPGATEAEVRYYQLDPFKWSWVVSFLSLCCLAAAFGPIRAPMYWLGVLLLIVGQTFSVIGFAMRTYITGWAPVTNMFETVVFVALVTAILGLWFTLAPLFGPAARRAWQMTAIPLAPAPEKLEENDLGMTVVRGLVTLPRLVLVGAVFYVLTQISYGEGTGYAIVRLAPRGNSINDFVVWIVGLSMLAIALWLVPRLVLTAVLGVIAWPWTLMKSGLASPMQKVMERKAFALVGAGTACGVGLIAYYAPVWDSNINPLMPVLRDNFWLTLHVLTITASYGAGFLAWGLGITAMAYYMFGRYRDPLAPPAEVVAQGHRPAHDYKAPAESFRRRVPEQCVSLSGYVYRAVQVAVVLLAAGTILGGLWADVSWGRFWGWDSKEVWALISLLIYVGILHFRFLGVFRDFALAAGAVFGITSIVMAWWGVNFFFGTGMHSYGSGEGGGLFVLGFVVFNTLVVTFATVRFLTETGVPVTPVIPPSQLVGKPASGSQG